jgi:serine protease
MRKSFSLSILLLLLSATFAFAGDGRIHRHHPAVAGSYVVKVSDDVPVALLSSFAERVAKQEHARVTAVFRLINGFALGDLTAESALKLSRVPEIDFVEEDGIGTQAVVVQQSAPWHLDRIDQPQLPLDGRYFQDCQLNPGVVAYVVDSGVIGYHTEFWKSAADPTSRVLLVPGSDFSFTGSGTPTDPCPDSGTAICPNDKSCDTYGGSHGTAVASVLAGRTFGAAKNATIIPVRVYNCTSGSTSINIVNQALEWVYNDHLVRGGSAVVNLSMAFQATDPNTSALELEIDKIVNQGNMTVVVSAGNGNSDAAGWTPARHSRSAGGTAITVGGSNSSDARWMCNPAPDHAYEQCDGQTAGSNFGSVVDIFAPSQNIRSAALKASNGDTSSTSERMHHLSGTSFSAPIVAGMAVRWLADYGTPSMTPAQVWDVIRNQASSGVMTEPFGDPSSGPLNGSPNRLAYFPPQARCRM